MKLTRIKIILVAAFALANGFFAAAQSSAVPGDTDYARFSQFITQRNIFDPNRYATTGYRPRTRPRVRTAGAPEFTLVGTLSYQKGMFVFFDGNNSDLKKILTTGDSIAGYTVKEVTATSVKLLGADKKEIEMKLGDQMRQEGGNWQLAGQSELPAVPAATESSENSTTSTDAPVAPSPSLEGNDILKRLMQQREQELK
ncbi:MAG TPA: hypothetical protein VGH42_01710 [Verrucomicrobiae bacterium]|jgi:hypothetical protein